MTLASEQAAVAAVIDPDAYAASTVTSGWMSMVKFRQCLAIVSVGTMAATSTVDAKIEQAQDSSGTGAKDMSPAKAITQFTAAGSDDDKQAVINVRADELDKDNNFTHIRLSMTIAVAASDADGKLIGLDPTEGAASDNDAATVDEIVT